MAFVSGNSPDQGANTDQDKDKNPLAQQAPVTSAPAGGGAGKATGQASSSAPAQPFTNLSAYLSANGPQVQAMGADIAGKLNTGYSDTMNSIDSAQQGFGQKVNQGYTEYDPNILNDFKTNPTGIANDPTKAATFKGMYNDRYTGPGSFQDQPGYADLTGKVQKGTAFANQVKTIPGLQSYLSSLSPTYTQGQATLDSSLLQTNPEATTAIQTAANPYANLGGYLEAATKTGNDAVTNANTEAQNAKTQTQQAYNDVANPFAAGINSEYAGRVKQSTDYNTLTNSLTGKIGNQDFASLTPEEQKLIGYNPGVTDLISKYPTIFPTQAQNHPINFANYFTAGDQAQMPQTSDVFTPEELATYQALTSLSGQGPMLDFDAPTTATQGTGTGLPGKLPQFNNQQASAAIEQAYRPLYNEALGGGINLNQGIIDYMNSLNTFGSTPQPGPQPTTPPPEPGTNGDLGKGFHWDTATGSWQPTIPLGPPGGDVHSGGGFHTF